MEEYNWQVNKWEPVTDGERAQGLIKLFEPEWDQHANDLLNSVEDELEDNRWELLKEIVGEYHERMFFSPESKEFKCIRRLHEVRTSEGRAVPKRRARREKT